MTPTTLDMTRTKSLIESDMQERMVWTAGGSVTTFKVGPSYRHGAVYDTKAAAEAGRKPGDGSYDPMKITLARALDCARSFNIPILLLKDITGAVVESWPVR